MWPHRCCGDTKQRCAVVRCNQCHPKISSTNCCYCCRWSHSRCVPRIHLLSGNLDGVQRYMTNAAESDDWGDLLLIVLMNGADYSVRYHLLNFTLCTHTRPCRWGSRAALWTFPTGSLGMGSEGPSSMPPLHSCFPNSWTSVPSGAKTYARCWRRIPSITLDKGTLSLHISSRRNILNFLTLLFLQHICYLAHRGQTVAVPPW